MSELQIGLLAIGVAIVIGVIAYNKWQEARFRRGLRSQADPPAEDVLLKAGGGVSGRVEPRLAGPTAAGSPGGAAVLPQVSAGGPPLSELLDAIVILEFEAESTGRALLEALDANGLRRPVRVEGEAQGQWERLRSEDLYRRARLGMQLVDRHGCAPGEDLEAFLRAARTAATALGGRAEAPDERELLRAAGELDRFCGEVDIQIAVHAVSRGAAFAGARIRELAESAGLSPGEDGRFSLRDGEGRVLFALAAGEPGAFAGARIDELETSTLLLELDVPRAPDGPQTFEKFTEFALRFADGLDARLVDDNQAELGEAAFKTIAAGLEPVYEAMRSRGIPPGGALALRLFS